MHIEVNENCQFPAWDYFLKLADNLKDNRDVKVFRNHKSVQGRELVAFAIGHGDKVIGVTSGAHSDEPIGVLTQVFFINSLLNEHKQLLSEYTFLCHPLVDPDGYVLNSKWFKNPLNYQEYYLNNYRNNKPSEDCEHGIPFQDNQEARPEMLFVKSNIDRYLGKFEYYVTLHSSHVLPGACFVFDKDHSDVNLRESITQICKKYDLPLMDYKAQGDDTMTYLGPGFIGAPTVGSMLEHYKNQPEILKQIKMTTYEYAQTFGGAKSAFISELPIWIMTGGFDDYSDSKMTMNELKEKHFNISNEYYNKLVLLDKEIANFQPDNSNPWYSSLQMALKLGRLILEDEKQKIGTYNGYAQILEVKELEVAEFENNTKMAKYALMSITDKPETNEIRKHRDHYNKIFSENIKIQEKILGLTNVSVKTQVEIQLGLILSGIKKQ